jgi:hypothetical protein
MATATVIHAHPVSHKMPTTPHNAMLLPPSLRRARSVRKAVLAVVQLARLVPLHVKRAPVPLQTIVSFVPLVNTP